MNLSAALLKITLSLISDLVIVYKVITEEVYFLFPCFSSSEKLQKEREGGGKVHLLTSTGGVTTILYFLSRKQKFLIIIFRQY